MRKMINNWVQVFAEILFYYLSYLHEFFNKNNYSLTDWVLLHYQLLMIEFFLQAVSLNT